MVWIKSVQASHPYNSVKACVQICPAGTNKLGGEVCLRGSGRRIGAGCDNALGAMGRGYPHRASCAVSTMSAVPAVSAVSAVPFQPCQPCQPWQLCRVSSIRARAAPPCNKQLLSCLGGSLQPVARDLACPVARNVISSYHLLSNTHCLNVTCPYIQGVCPSSARPFVHPSGRPATQPTFFVLAYSLDV